MTDRAAYKLRVTTVRGRARAQLAAIRKDRLSKRRHRQAMEDLTQATRADEPAVDPALAPAEEELPAGAVEDSRSQTERDADAEAILTFGESLPADHTDPSGDPTTTEVVLDPHEPVQVEVVPQRPCGDADMAATVALASCLAEAEHEAEEPPTLRANALDLVDVRDDAAAGPGSAPQPVMPDGEEATAEAEYEPVAAFRRAPRHDNAEPSDPKDDAPGHETERFEDFGAVAGDSNALTEPAAGAAVEQSEAEPAVEATDLDDTPPPAEVDHAAEQDATSVDARTDLYDIPGIGSGLVWMFRSAGIQRLDDLAKVNPRDLEIQLGMISRLLDLDYFVNFARTRGASS